MIADGEGRVHLSDLMPDQVELEPFFNADTDIIYMLFTRENPTAGQRLDSNIDSVRNSNFNVNRNTRFMIHGWNADGPSLAGMTAAYLRSGDFNVITVDWSAGSSTINYITARNRVNEAGPALSRFIDFLSVNGYIPDFGRVNVAGHSLGAHVAGVAGKFVTRGRLPKIIGLDPAGPLFDISNPATRLDASDAVYVEGINTNAGLLGLAQPVAHATL